MSNADKSQKTQKPTPKRREQFRKEGKIAMSRDLTSVSLMLIGGAMGMAFLGGAKSSLSHLMRSSLTAGPDAEVSTMVHSGVAAFIASCWPVMVGCMAGAIVAGGLQLGWPPAFKKIEFKPGKVFAFSGLKQLISIKQAGGRVLKATAKAALVLIILAVVIVQEYERYRAQPALDALAIGAALFRAVGRLGFYSVLVLGVLALIDYGFQKKKLMDEMMMSIQDIKDEHKKQEGDPQVKGKRRQRMREMAQRRVKSEVQRADVVIVNPTHYSVALRYDTSKDGAPRVVAKGKDEQAAKIREYARQAGVPIVSRPPLTRLVYRLVPEGNEIPPDLYQAIAEILAYVYRLRAPRRAA